MSGSWLRICSSLSKAPLFSSPLFKSSSFNSLASPLRSSCMTLTAQRSCSSASNIYRKTSGSGFFSGIAAGSCVTGAIAYMLSQKKGDDEIDTYISFMKENSAAFGPWGDHTKGEVEITLDKTMIEKAKQLFPDRKIGICLKTPWHVVVNHVVLFPNGALGTQLLVVPQQHIKGKIVGVVSLPILPDGRILLVLNYRRGLGKYVIECVRGFAEGDEPGLTVARRELNEETGAKIIKAKSENLGCYRSDSAITTGDVRMFSIQIEECAFIKPKRDDGEEGCLHTLALTREELDQAIARQYAYVKINGEVRKIETGTDGFLLSALHVYDLRHPKITTHSSSSIKGSDPDLPLELFNPSKDRLNPVNDPTEVSPRMG